jgi:hydrogenase-4 component E
MLLNLCIISFAITLVYLATAERIATHIRFLIMQGLLLFAIALIELKHINLANLGFILAETLIFKALIIPYYLKQIVERNKIAKTINTTIPTFYTLIMVSLAIILFFIFSSALPSNQLKIKYFTVSISAIFTGFVLIMTHREVISHLIGYLIIENGIFLLSVAIGSEMPMMVNTGILLDILISVVVLGAFVNRIGRKFTEMETTKLSELKD